MNTTNSEKSPASEPEKGEEQGRYEALHDRFAEPSRELLEASQEKSKERMRDKLTAHTHHIHEYGKGMPEIRDWKWPAQGAST